MQFTPKIVIIHHDGVSRSGPSLKIVDEYHKSQHFPLSSLGFYVGYHYLIERDGSTIQTRTENELGAHTIGQNYAAIGIGMAGNFDKEQPTGKQTAALGSLLSAVCFRHSIPYTEIHPHRKFNPKTCYGSLLSDTWAQEIFLRFESQRIAGEMAALGISPVAAVKKKAAGLVASACAAWRSA